MNKATLVTAVLALIIFSSIQVLALSQDAAIKTAETYLESTALPDAKRSLAETYPSTEIRLASAGVIRDKIEHIGSQDLWFVPLEMEFQMQKEGSAEWQLARKLFIPVYVDENSNSVSPALSKITSPDVFACSDGGTSTCSGVFISINDGGTIEEAEGYRGGRYVPNQEALSRYKAILTEQHYAQDKGNYWYVPASELKAIAGYDWVIEIQPNGVMTSLGVSQDKQLSAPSLGWIAGILVGAVVLFAVWKAKRKG
ncbi:MAG: hypothetical protein Q7S65_03310 [Nanoarchaeota archaeon]|nr:hypothetical protein [Nanoarchaeota archaeon]